MCIEILINKCALTTDFSRHSETMGCRTRVIVSIYDNALVT